MRLQAAGLAIRKQKHMMRVPRSQRGGDIVEPMVRDQWFVKTKPLAEPALQVQHLNPAGSVRIRSCNWAWQLQAAARACVDCGCHLC